MELTFQTKPVSWLRCILRECRRQEETSETIVPDTYPDIGSIVDSHATSILRIKEQRTGSVLLSGTVKGNILYLPDDHSEPRSMQYDFPFSIRVDGDDLDETSRIICDLRVTSVDGKIINSRKAMLRTELCCTIYAFAEHNQQLPVLKDPPNNLRMKRAEYKMELPLEAVEHSFFVSDTAELPPGATAETSRWVSCKLEVSDQKVVGARAVFRGYVRCKLLYLDESNRFCTQEYQLPFSQFCNLNDDYDSDEHLVLLPVITGYELEAEGGAESHTAYLNVHVLTQCLVFGKRSFDFVEDCYTINGVLHPQWETVAVEPVLDQIRRDQLVAKRIPEEIVQTIDTQFYIGIPTVDGKNAMTSIRVPVVNHILGYDSNGLLRSAKERFDVLWEIPSGDNVECCIHTALSGAPYLSGQDIHAEFIMDMVCTGKMAYQTLCGGAVEGLQERKREPAVLLRRAAGGSKLWEIAKSVGADEADIRLVNGLEGGEVLEDRVLLIPIV